MRLNFSVGQNINGPDNDSNIQYFVILVDNITKKRNFDKLKS